MRRRQHPGSSSGSAWGARVAPPATRRVRGSVPCLWATIPRCRAATTVMAAPEPRPVRRDPGAARRRRSATPSASPAVASVAVGHLFLLPCRLRSLKVHLYRDPLVSESRIRLRAAQMRSTKRMQWIALPGRDFLDFMGRESADVGVCVSSNPVFWTARPIGHRTALSGPDGNATAPATLSHHPPAVERARRRLSRPTRPCSRARRRLHPIRLAANSPVRT